MMRLCDILCCVVLLLSGCGGGSSSDRSVTDLGRTDSLLHISAELKRIPGPGLDAVLVSCSLSMDGQPVLSEPEIQADRGSLGFLEAVAPGKWEVVLTPAGTGLHSITMRSGDVNKTVHPIVCEQLSDDWGQARLVEGLVNSQGYEDGAHISKDGEWLFVHYGPVYMSGILSHFGDIDHPLNTNAIGPYAAPLRPGFYDTRIVDGTIEHYSTLLPELGQMFLPPTMFYGFHRQADSSFAEPFPIGINDAEGASSNAFGICLVPGTDNPIVVFALEHYFDKDEYGVDLDTSHDIYSSPLTLGQVNELANWKRGTESSMEIIEDAKGMQVLNLPEQVLGQGNPMVSQNNAGTYALWTDAEYLPAGGADSWNNEQYFENISVHELSGDWATGSWSLSILPEPINGSDSHERQPFFTGTQLYFARDDATMPVTIMSSDYLGGPFEMSTSWSEPTVEISAGTGRFEAGSLLAVGEPTIATRTGGDEMYFIAVLSRGTIGNDDDLDLDGQVAMVPRLPIANE
ncbi:MAG: hypothetical protein HQL32_08060 [Planctomycetes bacterium]|nr:hypothetical protein [Planctomycetota bacterium]